MKDLLIIGLVVVGLYALASADTDEVPKTSTVLCPPGYKPEGDKCVGTQNTNPTPNQNQSNNQTPTTQTGGSGGVGIFDIPVYNPHNTQPIWIDPCRLPFGLPTPFGCAGNSPLND